MKKVVALLVAALMAVSLTVCAFAAEDPTPSAEVQKINAASEDATVTTVAEDSAAATSLTAELESGEKVEFLFDVAPVAGTPASITLTINITGTVTRVLHWNGAAWEELTFTVGAGTLTINAPAGGWSPIAILVAAPVEVTGGVGDGAAAGTVSPQTGEVATSVYVACAAVMVVAAAAFAVKSKKAA